MYDKARSLYAGILEDIRNAGLYKDERPLTTPQGSNIRTQAAGEVINFCANNYLGLANDPELIAAAHEGLERHGYGLSSVRFICGTQDIHKELESGISDFLEKEDTILYSSCFDANGGLFETLLDADCAVISDALNHASIIDGIRLCKAERLRYTHNDLDELEDALKRTVDKKVRMIATDGVFSMDGDVARLPEICDLAERYGAMVMVDDSHATGFFGPGGQGSIGYCGVTGRVDIVTSTLGKALGGASGGFISGPKEAIQLLRQRSRPYLFSNALAPVITYTSLRVLDIIRRSEDRRQRLESNTVWFREQMTRAGFDIRPGVHPIVPIMLYDAKVAGGMAADLLKEGIYVVGFSYPVVPQGQARIRVQLSAAHTEEQLQRALEAFTKIGRQYGVIA